LPDVGFYLLPGVPADPLEKDIDLFPAVPFKTALG
jgi:hypothetical protein